jgi:hypothetical protein
MPVIFIHPNDDDMPFTFLLTSCAVIWGSTTRHATLFVNPTIDYPEDPERHGQPVTAEQFELYAYLYPPVTAAATARVLRLYLDYDTGSEEDLYKLTCIKDMPAVLSRLRSVVRRSIFLARR